MSSGESPRMPKEQMFVGSNKVLSNEEIKTLQEDGQLYIAVNLMDSEKLDEAAEILSKLDTPYGSYYLALVCLLVTKFFLLAMKYPISLVSHNFIICIFPKTR